jgi:tetratricopeptide (TPR) repeat protein
MGAEGVEEDRWVRVARRHPMERMRRKTGIGMLMLLFPVACTRISPHQTAGFLPFLASYAVLVVVWSVSVFLHEVGHVVAGRLAGLEPFALLSGGGPALFRRKIGSVVFAVRCLPGSGLTLTSSRTRHRLRWRLLASHAGGPAVTIALLLVGVGVPQTRHEVFANTTPWLSLPAALVLVNLFLLAEIVIPFPRGSNLPGPRNDFVQIVTLPWLPEKQIAAITAMAAGVEFHRLVLLQRYPAACEEARRLLAADPGNWAVRTGLAELLLFAGLHAEAATHYGKVLDDGAIPDKAIAAQARAMIANNAAWNAFMLADARGMETADKLSAEAVAVLPKHPSILGTRGAVLMERGKLIEGQKLLTTAHHRHRDRISKALNSACLAIAAARRGKHREARRLVERARKEDRECELIGRAEFELAERCRDTGSRD